MILGLGHDVVDVPAFAAQLAEPGSAMRSLFSSRELRQAGMRGQSKRDGEAVHLAAKWAGKEAAVKAWCEALSAVGRPAPYTLDDLPWSGIEILDDSRGVPHVALRADVERALRDSFRGPAEKAQAPAPAHASGRADADSMPATGMTPVWHISLSHDGHIASAVVMLERRDV